MAGTKGNKNNLKWTLKKAQSFLDEVYNYVKLNEKCNSLTKAAVECGEYETLIYHIRDTVKGIDFESIKKAKDTLKYRLLDSGLDGTYNATMVIFLAKNNHDMKDKSEVEKTVINDEPRINLNINGVDVDLKS